MDYRMDAPSTVCPVPSEQQPLNEFRELQESWFYRWATLDLPAFCRPVVMLWGMTLVLVAGPVAAVSFSPQRDGGHFLLAALGGALVGPTLALIQLYMGWRYVRDRLASPTVFYEESGWYDGQTWAKPEEVQLQDRLVVTYEIQPLLQRLWVTFASLGGVGLLGALLWPWV